jgi:hypothetical protein
MTNELQRELCLGGALHGAIVTLAAVAVALTITGSSL